MAKFILPLFIQILFISFAPAEVFEAPPKKKSIEDMVYIKDAEPFFIDIFEKGGYGYANKSDKPDTIKSVQEAEQSCAKVGKKLPTRAQWLAAASGVGKNKSYTLRGDAIKDPNGNLIPQINKRYGDNSLPINNFEKLGIDISGTTAMTGNRSEWVKDPDGSVYQCGGSYVDPKEEDLTLARICSKKEEGRWYYNKGTATVRCVLSFQDNKHLPLTYSMSVRGELKTYIDSLGPAPVLPYEPNTYEKVFERCNAKNGVEVFPLSGHQRLKEYNLSLLLVPIEVNGETKYFDCRKFGVGPIQHLKLDTVNTKPLPKVVVTPEVYNSLLPQKDFSEGHYADHAAITKYYIQYYAVDVAVALDIKAQQAFAYYQREKLLQEGIWLLEEQGLMQAAHNLKKQLMNHMAGPIKQESIVENKGVSDSKKIEVQFGTKGIFKTINQNYVDNRVKREVAAYWMDQLLELRIVPMTIIRRDSSNGLGSYQYWVRNAKMAVNAGREPTQNMQLLDAILGNGDRHTGNYLFIFDQQYGGFFDGRLSAVDHNRTFYVDKGPGAVQEMPSQYAWQQLQDLENDGMMHKQFDDFLNAEEMGILDRGITKVVNHIKNLIRTKGQDKVVHADKPTREPRPDVTEVKPIIPNDMPR